MRHIRFLASLAPVAFMALGCGEKAPDAPEVAPAETTATAADAEALAQETRDKLLALAVASECLRKGGTPPEEAANQMLALYKEKAIELTTYTIEMSKLAADPTFAAAIDAKTKECPTTIAPDAAAEVADTSDAAVDGGPDAAGEIAGEVTGDALAALPDAADAAVETGSDAAGETSPDTVVAAVDTAVADAIADTTPATPETVVIADTVAPIADTRVAPPPDTVAVVDTVAPEVVAPPEAISYSGTWTGSLSGGNGGTLRVAISERTITSAVATFGRTTVRLKGTISAKGALSLGGTSGQNFLRINGKVGAGARAISGTWDGVVDKKRSNGRFSLKR